MSAPRQESDDSLMHRLQVLLNRLDPTPPEVATEARALLGLRRLDEELAELVRDSAEDRGGVLVVRGEGDVRLISFETGPVTVELQVTERGSARDLVAQVTGTALLGAEVETAAGRREVPIEDSLFTADDVPAGLLRLRLRTISGRDLVTSWVRT
jgi:hypothetical protein